MQLFGEMKVWLIHPILKYLKNFCHAYLPGSSIENIETDSIRQADGVSVKVLMDRELSSTLIYTIHLGLGIRGAMYVKYKAIISFSCVK